MRNYKYVFLFWIFGIQIIIATVIFGKSESFLNFFDVPNQPIKLEFWDWSQLAKALGIHNEKVLEKKQSRNIESVLNLVDTTNFNEEKFTDGGFGGLSDKLDEDSILTDTLSFNQVINPYTIGDSNSIHNKRYLDPFFENILFLQSNQQKGTQDSIIRILHYGDSQIEGDRITKHLRYYFQNDFGGYGLGYIPILEQATHHAFTRRTTGYWNKFSVFNNRYKSQKYGASGCVFRYQKQLLDDENEDILSIKEAKIQKASVALRFPYRKARYDNIKLLFRNKFQDFKLKIYNSKDSLISNNTINKRDSISFTPVASAIDPKGFKLEFSSTVSPDIYGLYLESTRGIQVDNYALRGHSGSSLISINTNSLIEQISLLNAKLILFQYGGNIVPYNSPSFDWYEAGVYRMIQKFKNAAPNAQLILISVAGAAYKKNNEIIPYSSVSKIRAAQFKAARRAGIAYWDLYSVMGGGDGAINWIQNKPALIAHDLAHFTEYGQQVVARLFYSALMKSYKEFLTRRSNTKVN